MNTPFEITKEEVLELAATKVANEYMATDEDLHDLAHEIIKEKVTAIVSNGLKERVDAALTKELESLLSKEIVPVDIWGDKAGNPTTIRAQLHERAKQFWNVRVDKEGRESSYGGTPRSEHLMHDIVAKEFEAAIKANIDVMITAFKNALLVDATKLVTEHIHKLIQSPSR